MSTPNIALVDNRPLDIKLGDTPFFSARHYPPENSAGEGLAQVTLESGCTSFTFYPTSDALDALAVALLELSAAMRAEKSVAA